MKTFHCFGLLLIVGLTVSVGCQQNSNGDANKQDKNAQKEDSKIKAALAKLGPEEQKQAELQRICPVSNEPLGYMGKPAKITINNETVFLCCNACEKEALANPDETLATVKKLRAKSQEK